MTTSSPSSFFPSYSGTSSSSSLPSLCQIVALAMAYRRIFPLLMFAPIATLAAPLVASMAYGVLDRLTSHHTIFSLLLTVGSTTATRNLIRQSAPNPQAAREAVANTSVGLPMILFGVIAVAVNVIVKPLEEGLGIKEILTWSPRISFVVALRLASGMFFLGLAIVLRFVGPPSIMRCSSSPLLAHPFLVALQTFSQEALIQYLTSPSDMPGEVLKNPFEYKANARRLQNPTIGASFAQMIISAAIGVAVAYTCVLPFLSALHDLNNVGESSHGHADEQSSLKAALMISCISTTLIHLFKTALNGSSHEINPHRYRYASQTWTWRKILLHGGGAIKSLVVSSSTVTFFAVLLVTYVVSEPPADENDAGWTLAAVCFLTASLLSVYLSVFDEALRTVLSNPPLHMKQFVEEAVGDDRMDVYLDVAMHSLLHSDTTLVQNLSMISKNPVYLNMDGEEQKRNESAIKAMAHILLHKTSPDETGAHLEEDFLRVAILESLGGTSSSSNGQSQVGLDNIDYYHAENVKQWVDPKDKLKVDGTRSEPLAVPIVRALSAYVGGLGESLIICFSQKPSPVLKNPWLMPPGAIACGEYAVRAAARCIVFSLSNNIKFFDWRSTHLAMLIPSFLNSAHRLELGMIKLTNYRSGSKPSDHLAKLDLIRTESPELTPLFHACSDSATMVLERLKQLEGNRRIDFYLDTDCQKWVEGLWRRIPEKTTQPNNNNTPKVGPSSLPIVPRPQ